MGERIPMYHERMSMERMPAAMRMQFPGYQPGMELRHRMPPRQSPPSMMAQQIRHEMMRMRNPQEMVVRMPGPRLRMRGPSPPHMYPQPRNRSPVGMPGGPSPSSSPMGFHSPMQMSPQKPIRTPPSVSPGQMTMGMTSPGGPRSMHSGMDPMSQLSQMSQMSGQGGMGHGGPQMSAGHHMENPYNRQISTPNRSDDVSILTFILL